MPGAQTFYKDVMKLMPGQKFIYKNNVLEINNYYEFRYVPKKLCQEKYEEIIEKNIKKISKYNGTGGLCIFIVQWHRFKLYILFRNRRMRIPLVIIKTNLMKAERL